MEPQGKIAVRTSGELETARDSGEPETVRASGKSETTRASGEPETDVVQGLWIKIYGKTYSCTYSTT